MLRIALNRHPISPRLRRKLQLKRQFIVEIGILLSDAQLVILDAAHDHAAELRLVLGPRAGILR